jgi:hypothetical protein
MAAAAIIIMSGTKQSNCNGCSVPLTQGEHEFLGYALIVCVVILLALLILEWYNRNK